MGIYYHGTSLSNRENIINRGFELSKPDSSHSLGNGVYFTNIKENAMPYGEIVLTVELDDNKIIEFESYGNIQKYIYEKTGDIAIKYLKDCLLSDGYIGIKQDDMVVIYDVNSINFI
ncbi:hypothetical protein [Priestia megaterium]|uniref:hypothetical protein n=1 Tax=Priestia megaterium TaxID=1404 RepID=UPI0028778802|nr:hypothetical protein [Priestia megaterium]